MTEKGKNLPKVLAYLSAVKQSDNGIVIEGLQIWRIEHKPNPETLSTPTAGDSEQNHRDEDNDTNHAD